MRAAGIGADAAREDRLLVAQEIDPQRWVARVGRAGNRRSRTGPLWLEWQPAQVRAKTCWPSATAPAPNSWSSCASSSRRARKSARLPEVGRARGQEESDEVVEPVLDRAEARAVAPALADIERRLAVIALRRVDRAQVGHVVEPALLGAGADIEIDALDRFRGADRNPRRPSGCSAPLSVARCAASICRACPARTSNRRCDARGHCAALRHFEDPMVKDRPLREIEDRVHRAGIGRGVHRQRRGVDRAGPGARDELPFECDAATCPRRGSARCGCTDCRPARRYSPICGLFGSAGGFSGL